MPWTIVRLSAALLLAACQVIPVEDDPVPEDDSTGSEDPTTSDGGEVGDPTPQFGCDPGDASACPAGQKCTAISDGGFQNTFSCVNDDGTILAGEDCTPAPGTGQDGCAAGTVCVTDGPDDIVGSCVAACINDSDCEPGKCIASPYTLTPFCADSCDPLLPACLPGRQCMQDDDRFACGIPISETDVGVTGEACILSTLRGCAEGFACMPGALVPGCSSSDCCTPACDLNGGDEQCTVPSLCKVLFPEPAPDFESIGACYVPT